jgi:hypothetical protein
MGEQRRSPLTGANEMVKHTTPSGVKIAAYGSSETTTLLYPLTPCCGASTTGIDEGIVCRSCYTDIDFDDCLAYPGTDSREEVVRRITWWITELALTVPGQAEAEAKAAADVLLG